MKKKIVLLGDSAVGKTSLIRRFVFNQFEGSYVATIGSKVTMKEVKVDKASGTTDLTLLIWDVIGREGYHALHARTFVGVHGAILVADITRRETLETLERYWIPSLFKVANDVPLVFVCNKSDLRKDFEFEYEDLANVASKYNTGLQGVLPFRLQSSYATSAKDGSNVERAFESLSYLMLSDKKPVDPVKEFCQTIVATGVCRDADLTTPIGALDAIIVDFCEGFDDSRLAMLILRQEIGRAGTDVRQPDKEGIFRVVEYLAEAETEFKDKETVLSNRDRRFSWARKVRE